MYYVYGDLTPFYDRWGKQHTRQLAICRTLIGAWWKAFVHTIDHPHGSAFISRRKMTQEELGNA